MAQAQANRVRISSRVSINVQNKLERAAELIGSTLNQFIINSAIQEAQRIIEQESVIKLSEADAKKVFALIDNPPKPNKRLQAAVKSYRSAVCA